MSWLFAYIIPFKPHKYTVSCCKTHLANKLALLWFFESLSYFLTDGLGPSPRSEWLSSPHLHIPLYKVMCWILLRDDVKGA